MVQCTAIKRNGDRCTLPAVGKQGVCWTHDKNAEQRRRRASKGGRGKPSSEIRGVKTQLQELTDRVLSGVVERATLRNQRNEKKRSEAEGARESDQMKGTE